MCAQMSLQGDTGDTWTIQRGDEATSGMPCPAGERALQAYVCVSVLVGMKMSVKLSATRRVGKKHRLNLWLEVSLWLQACCALCEWTHRWKALEHVQRKYTHSLSPQVQRAHHVLSTTRQVQENLCEQTKKSFISV